MQQELLLVVAEVDLKMFHTVLVALAAELQVQQVVLEQRVLQRQERLTLVVDLVVLEVQLEVTL